ncbi:hypothetical protein QMK33_01410 [Hymenobacter sp. H14-R3]|uniref:hypothetical protein n=1 Tax=Hymenobacter sp. H14-R3 TaxID=3046308 RepID=UPI0024BBD84B|nr:hypothetical protein [Hymenobacter sp. H14-R3]MDJ0363792.1 hypothetical protein [Hymenobacter sp. H14-R3]
MKTPAPDATTSSTPVRKRTKTRPAARRRTDDNTYTDPQLRERLRTEIRAAAKGGEPGTWSARKSQLLTLAYQKAGGGYLQLHPNSKQKSLAQWTDQQWETSDAKPARRAGGTTRYLPTKAWDALTPAEKKATNEKKKAASKAGRPAAANTAAAKQARQKTE